MTSDRQMCKWLFKHGEYIGTTVFINKNPLGPPLEELNSSYSQVFQCVQTSKGLFGNRSNPVSLENSGGVGGGRRYKRIVVNFKKPF